LLLHSKLFSENIQFYQNTISSSISSPYENSLEILTSNFNSIPENQIHYFLQSFRLYYGHFYDFLEDPSFKLDTFVEYLFSTNKNTSDFENDTQNSNQVKELNYIHNYTKQLPMNISLEITEPEIISIISPMKFGKSSIFKMLSGILPFNNVSVEYFSYEIFASHKFKEEVGFSLGRPRLKRKKTVLQNLNYYRKLYDKSYNVLGLLEEFQMLELKDAIIDNLSHDVQIVINILKSLIGQPKFVFIDHVLHSMKEEYLNLIFEMLLKYKLNGSTIVLSESHLDIGWKIADRVALMQDGNIRKVINIKDLKQKYPASSVIVSYSEDQISYQKVFKFEEMGDEQFSQFVRSRLVNDISTISRQLDEIYKFEIGDDLNE